MSRMSSIRILIEQMETQKLQEDKDLLEATQNKWQSQDKDPHLADPLSRLLLL